MNENAKNAEMRINYSPFLNEDLSLTVCIKIYHCTNGRSTYKKFGKHRLSFPVFLN